jgi:hypothetical protein
MGSSKDNSSLMLKTTDLKLFLKISHLLLILLIKITERSLKVSMSKNKRASDRNYMMNDNLQP